MAYQKPHLPEKICEHCQKPMVWRKAWRNVWDTVKYCSTACQRQANRQRRQAGEEIWAQAPKADTTATQRFKRPRKVRALPKN
jgi:hypothetical protein